MVAHKSVRLIQALLVAFSLGGCSSIATIKQVSPHFSSGTTGERRLIAAERSLEEARTLERQDPMRALGDYLTSANAAYDEWKSHPGDKEARDLYNFAVARSIGVIEAANLDPWNRPLFVPAQGGQYRLTAIRHSGPDRNPADYRIIPADSLLVGGAFFERRITLEGIGAPVVVIGRKEKSDFRKALTMRRLYGAATAVIRFHGRRAEIEFFEPLVTEKVTIEGRASPLAADFSAPLAVAMVYERPEKLGLIRLLLPEKYAETARLTRLQPYDANRTPVIFVHGLQDTPASWAPMINGLRDDPEIRRRYQFWVFSYPSGYPYPYSATLLRKELEAVDQAFPDHKRIVLVGHSMGGMVSRLMVTDVGDKLWRSYFGKSPEQTNIPGESRRLLEEAIVFARRPEVQRVVFISTPHRGAESRQ